jgi:hypothetical protein
MTTNEIRFYLHSYDKFKSEIQALSGSLREYRLMDGVKAKIITNMPICHSGESVVESIIFNRFDYVISLENEIDSKMRLLNAINSVYFYLKEPARTIIEMRYFISPMINDVRRPKYNWREIAAEIDKSEDYCKEIDCKVIRKIQNKLFDGGLK